MKQMFTFQGGVVKISIMAKHRFHGAENRFEVVADFIFNRFGHSVKYVADVAGGQGMLSKILKKKYNYESEVIDPRKYQLVGVSNRQEEYKSEMASYYDLIIGLHPDEATKSVVESALTTKTLIIPCCNFWNQTKKLGRDALLSEIAKYYDENKIKYEKAIFEFKGPKNIGFITTPVL
jgi:hypothetical protein